MNTKRYVTENHYIVEEYYDTLSHIILSKQTCHIKKGGSYYC